MKLSPFCKIQKPVLTFVGKKIKDIVIQQPDKIATDCKSYDIKKDGMLLLIEYRGEDPAIPVKALHKTTVLQLNKELNANGFQLHYQGEFLPIQHFLLYKKK